MRQPTTAAQDILGVHLDGGMVIYREPIQAPVTITITDTGRHGVMRWSASWEDFEDTGATWIDALAALTGWLVDAQADGKVLR